MTKEQIHKRFLRIVNRALNDPTRWFAWEYQLPTAEGRRIPARQHYNGDVAIPGNQDGRPGKRGIN